MHDQDIALPPDVDASFLAALDASPALMWLSMAAPEGSYFNRAWTEFTGRSLQDEIGLGWMSGIHPDDLANIDAYAGALTAQQPFTAEYRLRRHDGAWRWMLDTGRPRFDRTGGFAGYVGSCIDITERKEAEEALARGDERLRLAQDAAGIGTYDWDIASGVISWSPQMFRLYGIDPQTPAPDIYPAWLARLHPDDRARADTETMRFVDEAESLGIEFRIDHPEKGERWIEGRGRVSRDAEGRPIRMIGVNLDMTDQRRAQEGIRESEQRIRDIAEHLPGIIYRRITHPDGRVEYPFLSGSNDAIFGVPRRFFEEAQPIEAMSRIIHFDDVGEMLTRLRHASETLTPLELEGRVLGEAGEVHWVRSLSRPRRRADGALIWDGVILDVTEDQRRNAERERAATMLRMSIEVAGVGTWDYDPASELVQGSAITNRAFGLPEDEQARPVADYMRAVHPDDVEWVREGIRAGGRERRGTSREYRLLGPEGEVRWVNSRGAFVRLADGTERIIGALTDITTARRQQADREAALQRQTDLLREMNHRVKNNLQLVLALLRVQDRRKDAPDPLAEIKGQVDAIADLHARLSLVTGAGQIDFAAHLREMLTKPRATAAVAVDLHCDPETCMLDLDRAVPLALVVHGLLGHAERRARAASPPGAVSVTLEQDRSGACTLEVGEGGGGAAGKAMPDDLDLRFLKGLCSQIGATLEEVDEGGVWYRVALTGPSGTKG